MTLAIRVVATMLIDPARGVIKGQRFAHDRVIGEPIQWARVMAQLREVDELVIFDVTHSPPDLELLSRIAAECNIPVAYGGGIHDVSTALHIIKTIADKVILKDSRLFGPIAARAGAQAVVACLDVSLSNGLNRYVDGWLSPEAHAIECVRLGAGEILLQSKDRDGMMMGFDLDLIRSVRSAIDVPLIVSSGAGLAIHFVEAVQAGADAVAAGAAWQFTDLTPNDVKRALADAGFPVRLMEAA